MSLDDEWSAPETAVMDAIRTGIDADDTAVLATIVDVEGSAYRGPGSKMLVGRETGVGSITAGCLEDVVVELAAEVCEAGRARVEQFDLTGEDDVWGLGVGCNGIIEILLEPLDERYLPVVDAYDAGREAVVYTVVDAATDVATVGDRVVVGDAEVDPLPADRPDWFSADLVAAAREVTADRDSATVRADGIELFVDCVSPPAELVLFGTGHDVAPVAELVTRSDFRVTVAGFRGADAKADRFPAADTVRSLSPAEIQAELDLDADTYAVVMTHNFVDDAIAVDELLRTDVPYVGLMGPTERFEEIIDEWHADGRPVSEAELDRLYTPVGLDLGGGTPYQIAHSIVAELLAVRFGRTPSHLRPASLARRRP